MIESERVHLLRRCLQLEWRLHLIKQERDDLRSIVSGIRKAGRKMGKATLAHQRAIGEIGQARAQKLTDAGLTVIYTEEYERLKARVAELEKRNKLLSDLTLGAADRNEVATQVLQEAMRR